jgi:hypothetical protein
MPTLGAGIHVFLSLFKSKTWMAGTSSAMTRRVVAMMHKKACRHLRRQALGDCEKDPQPY